MLKQTTQGYVLHSRPYRETSLLIDLFSKTSGRFSLVAKGIKRKSNQSQRAILQPFSLLSLAYTGKSDLKVLSGVELVNVHSRIHGRAMACGYYINELIIRALQEWQESPVLFTSYQSAIDGLIKTEHSVQSNKAVGKTSFSEVLRNFEVALLTELGVAPDWGHDIDGVEVDHGADYFYNLDHGFERVGQSDMISATHKRFSGRALHALATGRYHQSDEKECQQITQMLLRQIIGTKPLESRKLWV